MASPAVATLGLVRGKKATTKRTELMPRNLGAGAEGTLKRRALSCLQGPTQESLLSSCMGWPGSRGKAATDCCESLGSFGGAAQRRDGTKPLSSPVLPQVPAAPPPCSDPISASVLGWPHLGAGHMLAPHRPQALVCAFLSGSRDTHSCSSRPVSPPGSTPGPTHPVQALAHSSHLPSRLSARSPDFLDPALETPVTATI